MRRTTTLTILLVLTATMTTLAAEIPDRPEKLKFPELTFDVPDADSLRFELEDGTPVKPSFQLLVDRVKEYTPEWAAEITGIPAETIKRLAYEMGITARDEKIEMPISWTDTWGNEHETVTGSPVAFLIHRSGAMFPASDMRSNSSPRSPDFSICSSIWWAIMWPIG